MESFHLRRTPLFTRHLQLGARMVPFAGYEMPVQYSGVLDETKATRNTCGLFDVSHMGQFVVSGKSGLSELNRLVTNDLGKLHIGQAQYNILCNESGGVIDDLVIYRRSENNTYICVNASNRKLDWEWMKQHLPSSVTFSDESDETALIALQGPQAQQILSTSVETSTLSQLKYYYAVETSLFGRSIYLSRTGYTGEDGFEIYLPSPFAGEVWDKLLESGHHYGLVPCGLGARDTLRTEMGYPLHGHELSPTISPLSAGLSWAVKLKKTDSFIGQKALIAEHEQGPMRKLLGFIVEDRRIARPGYRIYSKSNEFAGEISSGTHSPHLNAPIALGFIRKERVLEESFLVEIRTDKVPVRRHALPFVPSKTRK